MAKYKYKYKYRPDYKDIYPGVTITDEVLAVLRESDRRMEYQEYDLKAERFKVDPLKQTVVFLPSREDSLDRLMDLQVQFRASGTPVEDDAIEKVLIEKMMRAIRSLSWQEQELIFARFFSNGGQGMSERKHASIMGIPRMTLNGRIEAILRKIEKLMEFEK